MMRPADQADQLALVRIPLEVQPADHPGLRMALVGLFELDALKALGRIGMAKEIALAEGLGEVAAVVARTGVADELDVRNGQGANFQNLHVISSPAMRRAFLRYFSGSLLTSSGATIQREERSVRPLTVSYRACPSIPEVNSLSWGNISAFGQLAIGLVDSFRPAVSVSASVLPDSFAATAFHLRITL